MSSKLDESKRKALIGMLIYKKKKKKIEKKRE